VVHLPRSVHDQIEWEVLVAYQDGYRAALADVAAELAELDARWRAVGARRYEQRVAARIAEMERQARRVEAELNDLRAGRPSTDWP
jgi:uncharacterized protein YukE